MSYQELANYLHVLSTNIVAHSKLPVTAETMRYAKDYSKAFTAVYPLLLTELDKISKLKISPGLQLNISDVTVQAENEMQQNRRRLLEIISGDNNKLKTVGYFFRASMPEYQSYYGNQYMKPYERFGFVSPRGDGLYDNYFVSSNIKQNNAKIKEVNVLKRSLLNGEFYPTEATIVLTPERKIKTDVQQPGAPNILTGWKFKGSDRILVAGVADDEGRLIFDGGKYPDDFPRFTNGWNFARIQEVAQLYDKTKFRFQILNGTRIVEPINGFRFYSGNANGSYQNYEVTNYKDGALSAIVRLIAGHDYFKHGPEETIILNVQDIPHNAGINYTRNSNIYFWTLNGQPLYGGIVSDEGYTLDIYSDEPLQYKYLYDRDENDAPIPVLNLIATVEISEPNAHFCAVYYVSEINDNGTITLSNLDRITDAARTYTAIKVPDETWRQDDIFGIVKYRWALTIPSNSYVVFGQYKNCTGWSYPT